MISSFGLHSWSSLLPTFVGYQDLVDNRIWAHAHTKRSCLCVLLSHIMQLFFFPVYSALCADTTSTPKIPLTPHEAFSSI